LTPYDRDLVTRGIRLYWRTLGQARNMIHETGEIEYIMSEPRGGAERIFDLHFPAHSANEKVAQLAKDVREGRLPRSILVPLDPEPPDLADLLHKNGYTFDASGACMLMDLDTLPETFPPTPGVEVCTANNPDLLDSWVRIVNTALAGYELMSREQFMDLYCLEHVVLLLGTFHGSPAATGMVLLDGDLASLEMVSTLPEFRRKGLGSAVTLAGLELMKQRGAVTATLRAEPDGIAIYRKAGFREVCPRTVAYLEK
jgi:ribosomal protein S18 acetylase RimI-like enzyme